MMIYCTDSLLLKALCSNGYTQFSRLDSVPYTYHLLGSPIPRTTYFSAKIVFLLPFLSIEHKKGALNLALPGKSRFQKAIKH
jgi:hypothetical protein